MRIQDVIERFMQVDGSVVGHGPRHPKNPEKSALSGIQSLFRTYPLLGRDPCYRDFLEIYSGAAINHPKRDIVNILGFSKVSLGIEEMDGPLVEDGFFLFAICVYQRDNGYKIYAYEHDFSFDVSGTRKPGVYRAISEIGATSSQPSWYIGDFCSWLEDLIQKGGIYERPSRRGNNKRVW